MSSSLSGKAGLWLICMTAVLMGLPSTWPGKLLAVALLAMVALGSSRPRVAAAGTVLILTGISSPLGTLAVIALVQIAMLGASGEFITAIIMSLCVALLHVPEGVQAVVMSVCVQELALFGGYKYRLLVQRRAVNKSLHQYLHDTTVADLTAVVAEAEVMKMRHPQLALELDPIIASSRSSIASLRSLVHPGVIAPTRLQAAGFSVRRSGPAVRTDDYTAAILHRITAELATNIIKYGDRATPVTITTTPGSLTITNAIASSVDLNSSSLGLPRIAELAQRARLTVHSSATDGTWVTTVSGIPWDTKSRHPSEETRAG